MTSPHAGPLRPRRARAACAGPALLCGAIGGALAWQVRTRLRDARVLALEDELAVLRHEGDALAAELRAEARTDPLTRLANVRQWQEQLALELERARRAGTTVALALVDLDRFKQVNDSRGHAAGDALLREVAAGFAQAVRSVDLVARVGGEEFAVALPDASTDDAVAIVERLRTSLAGAETCSAGLAVWDGVESAEALQDRADSALYRAKAQGRDRLVVH
jgi:diguanylate cyclase (GGDEF)-like protein